MFVAAIPPVDSSCAHMHVHIASRFDADVQLNIADDADAANSASITCDDLEFGMETQLWYYQGAGTDEHHKNPNEGQNGVTNSRWGCYDLSCCPKSMGGVNTITCDEGKKCEVRSRCIF